MLGGIAVAQAQPVSVGLEISHYSNHLPFSGVQTFIELAGAANRGGSVRTALFGWSNSPCPAAVKIKFFRPHPAIDLSQSSYELVAERGPFDVTEPLQAGVSGGLLATQTVALSPPVRVEAGDLIALAVLTSCGGPTYTGFPPGSTLPPRPLDVLVVPGETTSTVFRASLPLVGTILAKATGLAVNQWVSIGPKGVKTVSVAASSSVILAGGGVRFCDQCPDGGLFRTTDGGRSWTDVFPGAATDSIAMAPSNTSIVYASRRGRGVSVWKSLDSGATWMPTALENAVVGVLKVDPSSPLVVWAGADSGLFRSSDGGATWSKVLDGPRFRAIALASPPSRLVYAGSLDYGAFRSLDGGETWSPLHSLLGTPTIPTGRIAIEVGSLASDPADPRLIFASARLDFIGLGRPPDLPRLYRSADAGDSWLPVGGPGTPPSGGLVVIPPTAPTTVYATSLDGVYRSADRGITWNKLTTPPTRGDVFDLAVSPNDASILYGATSDGLARLLSDPTTLVVAGGRFEVTARFRTGGEAKPAQLVALTETTGAFWFFTPNNVEVAVKILDGRPTNGHFWVFGAALTNVEYTLEVDDTETGALWTHHNAPGTLASFADTLAF